MKTLCPVCRKPADRSEKNVGDTTQFVCPECGGHRLAGTVMAMIEKGTIKLPTPLAFKELVKKKRGASTEYPVITTYDLGA